MNIQSTPAPDETTSTCPRCESKMFLFHDVELIAYYGCVICGHHRYMPTDNERFTGGDDTWRTKKNLGRPKKS